MSRACNASVSTMRAMNAAALCLMLVMGSTLAVAERIPPTFVAKVRITYVMCACMY